VSTPFQGRPGAQASYDAIRRRPGEPDVTDMLGAHQNRLEDLDRRVSALEAKDGDDTEDSGGGS
jgi:hypothetical protein